MTDELVDKDKRRRLYDNLVKAGYDLPDYGTFSQDMRDPAKLERLHTSLVKEGYEIPDMPTFQKDIASDLVERPFASAPTAASPSGADGASPSGGPGQPQAAGANPYAGLSRQFVEPQQQQSEDEAATQQRVRDYQDALLRGRINLEPQLTNEGVETTSSVRERTRIEAKKLEGERLLAKANEVPVAMTPEQGVYTGLPLNERDAALEKRFAGEAPTDEQKKEKPEDAYQRDVRLSEALNEENDRLEGRSLRLREMLRGGMDPNSLQHEWSDIQAGKRYLYDKQNELYNKLVLDVQGAHPESMAGRIAERKRQSEAAYQRGESSGTWDEFKAGMAQMGYNTIGGTARITGWEGAANFFDQLSKYRDARVSDKYRQEYPNLSAFTNAAGGMGLLLASGNVAAAGGRALGAAAGRQLALAAEGAALGSQRASYLSAAAAEAGNLGQSSGLFVSAYLPEYEGYVQQAMNSGADTATAEMGAKMYAPIAAWIEFFNPQLFLGQPAAKSAMREAFMSAASRGFRGRHMAKEALSEFVEQGWKEGAEEVAQGTTQTLTNGVVNYLAGTRLDDSLDPGDLFKQGAIGFLLGGPLGGVAGAANTRRMTAMEAEAVKAAVEDPSIAEEAISQMPKEQQKKAADRFERLRQVYQGNNLGELPAEDAARVAGLIQRKEGIEEEISSSPMDPTVEKAKGGDPRAAKIAEIDEKIAEIVERNIPLQEAIGEDIEGLDRFTEKEAAKQEQGPAAETQTTPTQNDAVQVGQTEEVPVQPEAGSGGEVRQPQSQEGGKEEPQVPEEGITPPAKEPAGAVTPKAAGPRPFARVPPSGMTEQVPDDPVALANEYIADAGVYHDEGNLDSVLSTLATGSVSRDSYLRFGDRNNITQGFAKTYLRAGGKGIDQIAQEASDMLGREVTTDDVVEFMHDNPGGRPVRSERMAELAARYEGLVGKRLTRASAKALLEKVKNDPIAHAAVLHNVEAREMIDHLDAAAQELAAMSEEEKEALYQEREAAISSLGEEEGAARPAEKVPEQGQGTAVVSGGETGQAEAQPAVEAPAPKEEVVAPSPVAPTAEPVGVARDEARREELKKKLEELKKKALGRANVGGSVDVLAEMIPVLAELGYLKIKDMARYLRENGFEPLIEHLKEAYSAFRDNANLKADLKYSLDNEREVRETDLQGAGVRTPVVSGAAARRGARRGPGRGRHFGRGRVAGRQGEGSHGPRPAIVVASQELLPTQTPQRVPQDKYPIDEHQRLGVNLALDRFANGHKAFMLGDGVGVGKTREILATANEIVESGGRVLIITKSQNVINDSFKNDAKAMGIPLDRFSLGTYNDLSPNRSQRKEGIDVGGNFDLVIFDESHLLKNFLSQRAAASEKIKARNVMYVTATPFDRPDASVRYLRDLTGLPQDEVMKKLGVEFFYHTDPATGEVTVQSKLKNGKDAYWTAVKEMRDGLLKQGAFVRREFPFWGEIGFVVADMPADLRADIKQIEEIASKVEDNAEYEVLAKWANNRIRARGGNIRFEQKDEIKGLQKAISSDPGMEEEYRKRYARWLGNERKKQVMAIDKLNEAAKVDMTMDRIQKALQNGEKVIVVVEGVTEHKSTYGTDDRRFGGRRYKQYGYFEKSVDTAGKQLQKRLKDAGIGYGMITGGVNDMAGFNEGDVDVLVMTAASGGTGINLDDRVGDAPRRMIMVTPPWGGDTFEQTIGRVSRRNTASPSQIDVIRFKDNKADDSRERHVKEKRKTLAAINLGADPDEMRVREGEPSDEELGIEEYRTMLEESSPGYGPMQASNQVFHAGYQSSHFGDIPFTSTMAPIYSTTDDVEPLEAPIKLGGMRRLQPGERAWTERQFTTKQGIQLYAGKTRIETEEDVAFIFRALENSATENSFALLAKPDGSYMVLFMGSGHDTATTIDHKALLAAVHAFGASMVWFVHNHPSGQLKASGPDMRVHKDIVASMPKGVVVNDGIIINLDSGKYATFNEGGIVETPTFSGENVPTQEVQIHAFDKKVLLAPSDSFTNISSSQSVAEFLSAQKRGTGEKGHLIYMSRNNDVVGYTFNQNSLLDADGVQATIDQIRAEAPFFAATAVIIATNVPEGTMGLSQRLSSSRIYHELDASSIQLSDIMVIGQDPDITKGYDSLADAGYLYEPGSASEGSMLQEGEAPPPGPEIPSDAQSPQPVPLDWMALVQLYRRFGKHPMINKSLRQALGVMRHPPGSVELKDKLTWDRKLATSVLGHEIGHFIDLVVEEVARTDKGGLAGISKKLRPLTDLRKEVEKSKKLKEDAKALSTDRRGPFSPNDKYRNNAKELFADYMSVMFTDPEMVRRKYPALYEAFTEMARTKPQFREAYKAVVDMVSSGDILSSFHKQVQSSVERTMDDMIKRPEKAQEGFFQYMRYILSSRAAAAYRRLPKSVRNSMEEGWKDRLEYAYSWASKENTFLTDDFSKKVDKALKGISDDVIKRYTVFNRYMQAYRTVHERRAAGRFIEEYPEEARQMLETVFNELNMDEAYKELQAAPDRAMYDIAAKWFFHIHDAGLAEKAASVIDALDMEDMPRGEDAMMAFNVRGKLSNPYGLTEEHAKRELQMIKEELTEEQYASLTTAARELRELLYKIQSKAHDEGLISDHTWNEVIEPNRDAYAPYAVLDHWGGHVGASIKAQTGTAAEVGEIVSVLMMKASAWNAWRGIQRQVRLLMDVDEKATGLRPIPVPLKKGVDIEQIRRRNAGDTTSRLLYYVQGKPAMVEFKDDPGKFIERSVEDRSFFSEHPWMGKLLRITAPITQLYTLLSPAFTAFLNPGRGAKTIMTRMGLRATARQAVSYSGWKNAVRIALDYSRAAVSGSPALLPETRALIEANVLAPPRASSFGLRELSNLEEMLQNNVLLALTPAHLRRKRTAWERLTTPISRFSSMYEALEKIQHYQTALRETGSEEMARAYGIRGGIPKVGVGGRYSGPLEIIAPWTRVRTQGLRASVDMLRDPKRRASYIRRWITYEMLPRLLYFSLAAKLLWDDDDDKRGVFEEGADVLGEAYRRCSPYKAGIDLMVPTGWYDPYTGKYYELFDFKAAKDVPDHLEVVSLRLPSSEEGRLAGPLLYNVLSNSMDVGRANQSAMGGVFDWAETQLPTESPIFEGAGAVSSAVHGRNPRDPYTGGPAMNPTLFEAGWGHGRGQAISGYLAQQFGATEWLGKAAVAAGWLDPRAMQTLKDRPLGAVTPLAEKVPVLSTALSYDNYAPIRERATIDAKEEENRARLKLFMPDDEYKLYQFYNTHRHLNAKERADQLSPQEQAQFDVAKDWYYNLWDVRGKKGIPFRETIVRWMDDSDKAKTYGADSVAHYRQIGQQIKSDLMRFSEGHVMAFKAAPIAVEQQLQGSETAP